MFVFSKHFEFNSYKSKKSDGSRSHETRPKQNNDSSTSVNNVDIFECTELSIFFIKDSELDAEIAFILQIEEITLLENKINAKTTQ